MTDLDSVETAVPAPAPSAEKKLPRWASIWGWYGVFAIFGAYYALSMDHLEKHLIFQFLNASGAIGLAVVCFMKRTWQPFALNVAWSAIACYAIWNLLI